MASTPSQVDLEMGQKFEQVAADLFVKHLWGASYSAVKRSERSFIDMSVVSGAEVYALLEVKARRVDSDIYDSTIVHVNKHTSARSLYTMRGWRTACLVIFEDKAGYFWLDERPDGKEFVARADRNGEGADHALYSHTRIIWVEGLREQIEAATAE